MLYYCISLLIYSLHNINIKFSFIVMKQNIHWITSLVYKIEFLLLNVLDKKLWGILKSRYIPLIIKLPFQPFGQGPKKVKFWLQTGVFKIEKKMIFLCCDLKLVYQKWSIEAWWIGTHHLCWWMSISHTCKHSMFLISQVIKPRGQGLLITGLGWSHYPYPGSIFYHSYETLSPRNNSLALQQQNSVLRKREWLGIYIFVIV